MTALLFLMWFNNIIISRVLCAKTTIQLCGTWYQKALDISITWGSLMCTDAARYMGL